MEKVNKVVRHGLEMRQFFDFKIKMNSWYPRHMNKGFLQVQAKLHAVDCLVEVHDARIPLSGRNSRLSDLGIIKPSVLVMNKVDLIDSSYVKAIQTKMHEEGVQVLFSNCKVSNDKGVKQLVPSILEQIKNSERFNRCSRPEYTVMVIGIPNVGKSSIINALRNFNLKLKKASAVGGVPGVTRSVLTKIKVHSRPDIYVLDTPGILSPQVTKASTAFKLSLAATVKQSNIPEDILADYLLFSLNKSGRHEYVDYFGMERPTDNIMELLTNIATKSNSFNTVLINGRRATRPDFLVSATKFINLWRKGTFGCCMLDGQILSSYLQDKSRSHNFKTSLEF